MESNARNIDTMTKVELIQVAQDAFSIKGAKKYTKADLLAKIKEKISERNISQPKKNLIVDIPKEDIIVKDTKIVRPKMNIGVKSGGDGPIVGSEWLTDDGNPLYRDKNKVAIVGFAPSSMFDVKYLFDQDDVEIWGLNQLYIAWRPNQEDFMKKVTRWFQIHHKHDYEAAVGRDHSHHGWLGDRLSEFGVMCYMQHLVPEIPMSVPFLEGKDGAPCIKDMITSRYGTYFTNSISWMLVVAILETALAREHGGVGFEHIHIYGVDMAQGGFGMGNEYSYQRPSVEYFVGIARGMGIKVYVPEKCDLLKAMWMYPFESDCSMRVKMDARRQELQGRVNQTRQQFEQCRGEAEHLAGEVNSLNGLKDQMDPNTPIYQNTCARIGELTKSIDQFRVECEGFKEQAAQLQGALDNMSYIEQCWMSNAKEIRPQDDIAKIPEN
jgi:hypothetical protein